MFATCYHKSYANAEQMFHSSWDYRACIVLPWKTTRSGLGRTCLVHGVMGLLKKDICTWG